MRYHDMLNSKQASNYTSMCNHWAGLLDISYIPPVEIQLPVNLYNTLYIITCKDSHLLQRDISTSKVLICVPQCRNATIHTVHANLLMQLKIYAHGQYAYIHKGEVPEEKGCILYDCPRTVERDQTQIQGLQYRLVVSDGFGTNCGLVVKSVKLFAYFTEKHSGFEPLYCCPLQPRLCARIE